jgi:hypothetical protein
LVTVEPEILWLLILPALPSLQEKVPTAATTENVSEEDLGCYYIIARVATTVNTLSVLYAVVSEHVSACALSGQAINHISSLNQQALLALYGPSLYKAAVTRPITFREPNRVKHLLEINCL